MENNETINKYELIVIVDANQTSEDKEAIIKDVSDELTKQGAKVINSQVWMEKQRFTFEIKKLKEGTYYTVNFESTGATNDAVTRALNIKDKVLRAMISVVNAQPAS
ncbi:MAG: small subunit ribosomal protein S6 [Lysobacterales bacterium]|jgi:small subunit ribosomal protein S6